MTLGHGLILDEEFAEVFEGGNDSQIAGPTILGRYIGETFRTWGDFDTFKIAVRVARDPKIPRPPGDA